MRRLYLCDCAPGDIVEDVYIVTGKQLSATQTGKHFIKAFLSDRTSQVTARMWNATREIFASMPESGVLKIRGRVENYQNNLQFIIEQMWPAKEGSYDIDDLLPHTKHNIDEMIQKVFELCQSIQNRHLAAIIQAYLDDEELMLNFAKAPAAMSFHHAYIGGLLEHTVNAMSVADAIMPFYPGLSRDLVLAGVFLHDIAKTWELSYDTAFGYTDGGQLVGHIVKSAMWVEHKAKVAEETLGEKIPQALIDVLQHIILSHHGVPEFGAAKLPSTPEAIAVHYIENLDAKMMMSLGATRGETNAGQEGNWTEYMKAFGVRMYRPDVAPAEAVEVTDEQAPEDRSAANANSAPAKSITSPTSNQPQSRDMPATPDKPAGPVKITNPLFEAVPNRKR